MKKTRALILAAAMPFAMSAPAGAQNAPTKVMPKLSATQIKAAMVSPRVPISINPCACLKPYVDWCKQTNSQYFYSLAYFMTTNNQTGLVSYSEGILVYDASKGTFESNYYQDPMQLFNDRLWGTNSWGFGGHPFDPNKADKLGISISANACNMKVTLKSWGNATSTVPLQCQNGVLYGWGPSPNPNLYTISIKKLKQDIPQ